jgi:hypothetical protein
MRGQSFLGLKNFAIWIAIWIKSGSDPTPRLVRTVATRDAYQMLWARRSQLL